MKKKSLIIFLCLILIICAGFAIYLVDISSNSVKVGQTYFTLPIGYSEIESKENFVNISNGVSSICINYFDDTDIMGHIDNYTKMKNDKNVSVKTTEFSLDKIKVYKSVLVKDDISHYWFINDDKVYEIYSWDTDSNTESIVIDLIKSMKTF